MNRVFALSLAAAALSFAGAPARAVTVSANAAAPTVNGADIANLGASFSAFQSSFEWSDRPARGQTFTTGSNALGYTLDALTVQSDVPALASSSYRVRVGSVTGNSFTQIANETGSYNQNFAAYTFITFLLNTPLTLAPNSTYGFDIGLYQHDGGFRDHGWGLLNTAQTAYAGGSAYSSGANATGNAILNLHQQDRIFHVNLAEIRPVVVVPEPASAALGLLTLAGLTLCRRRN
jgi:MYXO-CTERM domain-containing protein